MEYSQGSASVSASVNANEDVSLTSFILLVLPPNTLPILAPSPDNCLESGAYVGLDGDVFSMCGQRCWSVWKKEVIFCRCGGRMRDVWALDGVNLC